jgi:hypothetical protein
VPVQAAGVRAVSVQPLRTAPPRASASRRAQHVGRAGAAAAVVVAVLSASGVAAAVTGNPLAPAQSVAHAVAAVFGHGPNQHANDRAKLESSMRDVDALIRAGRLDEARALLAQLESQNAALGDKSTTGIENQLAALESKLARATAAGTTQPTPPGATKAPSSNKPTSHLAPTPRPSRTSGGTVQTPPVVAPTSPAPTPPVTRTHPTRSAPGGKNAPTKG